MLRISKNSGLTDIISTEQNPLIRNSDSVQVDYDEIPGYPDADMSIYHPNPAYNSITTQHPTTGSAQEVRVWLFNDDPSKSYQNINIDPTDTIGTDESGRAQLAPDNAGVAGAYGAAGAPLSMANVTAANAGVPFWVKFTTPAEEKVMYKTDIKLTINYKEFPA